MDKKINEDKNSVTDNFMSKFRTCTRRVASYANRYRKIKFFFSKRSARAGGKSEGRLDRKS